MELIKVLGAKNVLESLSDREDISASLSYWMTKFVIECETEYNFYCTEMQKLIDKYKDPNAKGEVKIAEDKQAEFAAEIEKLEKMDVEAPKIRFPLSEIAGELKLSMKQIYPLMDFIEETK